MSYICAFFSECPSATSLTVTMLGSRCIRLCLYTRLKMFIEVQANEQRSFQKTKGKKIREHDCSVHRNLWNKSSNKGARNKKNSAIPGVNLLTKARSGINLLIKTPQWSRCDDHQTDNRIMSRYSVSLRIMTTRLFIQWNLFRLTQLETTVNWSQ